MITIGVDSHLELHTTILGWQQYGVLWDLLTQSGLVFLPFLGILVRVVSSSIRTQKGTNAPFATLRRIEWEIGILLVVILVAGQPSIPLNTDQLAFTKLCVYNKNTGFKSEQIKASNDPSLYKTMRIVSLDKETLVPAWWYGVMAFASGITHAAKSGIPCAEDIASVRYAIEGFEIEDTALQSDIFEFMNRCYMPTRSFTVFGRHRNPADWNQSAYDALIAAHGKKETQWIGSKVFLNMPGQQFYSERVSPRAIKLADGTLQPISCKAWWTGDSLPQGQGIFDRVVVEIKKHNNNVLDAIDDPNRSPGVGKTKKLNLDNQQQLELAVRQTVGFVQPSRNVANSLNVLVPDQKPEGGWDAVWDSFYKSMSSYGAAWKQLIDYPLTQSLQDGAPVTIAVVTMSFYIMLPLGLLLASYSIEFIVLASIGLFTVKFISYLFYVALWMNQNLLGVLGTDMIGSFEERIYQLVINSLFLVLPVAFISMMGWAMANLGYGLQNAYDSVGGSGSGLASSAQSGGSLAQSTIDRTGRSTVSGAVGGPIKAGAGAAGSKLGSLTEPAKKAPKSKPIITQTKRTKQD